MRVIGTYLLILGLALTDIAAAQPSARDPQAVTIVSQVLAATGGPTAIAAITDFTAKGTVTYYWAESAQGAVTIRGRGLHQFRLDASLADGQHSWLINGSTTFKKNPNGSTSPLPSQNTVNVASATFPLLRLLSAFQDTATSISDGGVVTRDGQQVRDIIVQKNFPLGRDPGGALSKITKAHIFIDTTTMTVESIEDSAYAINGPGEYSHEMQFSGYEAINGVLVPLTITEFIAGQKIMMVQLNQVTFNTGLSDADFE